MTGIETLIRNGDTNGVSVTAVSGLVIKPVEAAAVRGCPIAYAVTGAQALSLSQLLEPESALTDVTVANRWCRPAGWLSAPPQIAELQWMIGKKTVEAKLLSRQLVSFAKKVDCALALVGQG